VIVFENYFLNLSFLVLQDAVQKSLM